MVPADPGHLNINVKGLYMQQSQICILGGTGFLGRSIAPELVRNGHRVLILTRHRERNRDLLVNPSISLVEADIFDVDCLRRHFRSASAVINLVGILNQNRRGEPSFQRVHVVLTETVADAVTQTGVPRLLHMSASNADPSGPSQYLQTKGTAEDYIQDHGRQNGYAVTSFRPSVIFGPDDSFTNRFAHLLRSVPLVFPLACPESRLQPVYVNDVARCFTAALFDESTFGQRYDLCGPKVYTLREIVAFIADTIGLKRQIIGLTDWQSKMQASVLQWFPGKPFTPDNFQSLQVASICSKPFPQIFNLAPRAMEDLVANYLNIAPEKFDTFRKRIPQ